MVDKLRCSKKHVRVRIPAHWTTVKYHGHKDARLMNGGRKKWELEKRALTTEPPPVTHSEYPIPGADESLRAYRSQQRLALRRGAWSWSEFTLGYRSRGEIHRGAKKCE